MSLPKYELAQVINKYGKAFQEKHKPKAQQKYVLRCILRCRTSALGARMDACEHCGAVRIVYNSCRNRHCPKCQTTNREHWIDARHDDLLDTPYFHVVFTVPDELNPLFLKCPAKMFSVLFEAVSQTLKTFASDKKYLAAQSGHIAVLHTWGQNLSLHPHIHCIVPGGGITPQGKWKQVKGNGKYLYPVKAMSPVFKAIFIKLIKQQTQIPFNQDIQTAIIKKPWVVYCKQPFFGPKQVIEYLGRYTHKIAISNHRLRSIDNDEITFDYKDYRHGDKVKQMSLAPEEFLRRFCMHILPFRFVKIRHYGILASRNKALLREIQFAMGIVVEPRIKPSWAEMCIKRWGLDAMLCKHCKTGRMVTVNIWHARAPPPAPIAPIQQ